MTKGRYGAEWDQEEYTFTVEIEKVWRAVRRWAKRHGHEYDQSYGVVNVAAC